MKSIRITLCAFMCLLPYSTAAAQTNSFNLLDYQKFLEQHSNMTTAQLLDMYPAGQFSQSVSSQWESALYHDAIQDTYDLTAHEKLLLNQHGFVVSERLAKNTFAEQFIDIWHNDLPVFISIDAILHAFHYQYDSILKTIEKGLHDRLVQMLTRMHQKIPELVTKYAKYPEMERKLRDVDIYITVPLNLLEQNISPNYEANQAEIEQILTLINAETLNNYPFFSDHCKEIDFSQFRPRGHYVEEDRWPEENDRRLPNYFRAMMWFGRIEIYLLPPHSSELNCPKQTPADIQRQTIDAVLLAEILDVAGVNTLYHEIEDALLFFAGEQDNVTLTNLNSLTQSIHLTNAGQLLNSLVVKEFQDSLLTKSYAFQRIVSQILGGRLDPSDESVRPASAFMLFGQRFVIDSYVTGRVVYDQIKYNNDIICRLFPSTLDILFALGNDAAAQLLVPELDEYYYSSNLTTLRYLVDSYETDFWESSIYSMWLNCIRALNPPHTRDSMPSFMQTGVWWQQKMNTQLASWTELRHDYLLYAKQSYTAVPICSFPYGYVEPFPEFFRRFKLLAEKARDRLKTFETPGINIVEYFNLFYSVCDTLETIAAKELAGSALDNKEISFIQSMILADGTCGQPYDGWYLKLCYFDLETITREAFLKNDYLVADYHTTPADCGGGIMGWISHAGTGSIDLAIVTAPTADGQVMAFVGPVSSYHEYVTTDFLRLTDQEWREIYLASATRPNWVNLFLANSEGQSRGPGASLFTVAPHPERQEIENPSAYMMLQNYPNPFNSSTIIRFSIPQSLAHVSARLIVYNLQGKLIKRLVEQALPAGTYLTKWDGKDDLGNTVASGVYFCELRAGSHHVTGKMNLLR